VFTSPHEVPLDTDLQLSSDVFFTAVSFVVAAVCNPLRILRQVWPHITVLVAFASFIIWNGGVVLGKLSYSKTCRPSTPNGP
jgi:alpha-1,2-glucosyltransferase